MMAFDPPKSVHCADTVGTRQTSALIQETQRPADRGRGGVPLGCAPAAADLGGTVQKLPGDPQPS